MYTTTAENNQTTTGCGQQQRQLTWTTTSDADDNKLQGNLRDNDGIRPNEECGGLRRRTQGLETR